MNARIARAAVAAGLLLPASLMLGPATSFARRARDLTRPGQYLHGVDPGAGQLSAEGAVPRRRGMQPSDSRATRTPPGSPMLTAPPLPATDPGPRRGT
jgi:hypothetical protein